MNILSLFPAVPLVMMLGLWLSKSTRQIHTVMVAGSSLLVALAVVLVVQYLGLRGAGETAQMLFTESRVWYAPLNIHYAVGVDGISVVNAPAVGRHSSSTATFVLVADEDRRQTTYFLLVRSSRCSGGVGSGFGSYFRFRYPYLPYPSYVSVRFRLRTGYGVGRSS